MGTDIDSDASQLAAALAKRGLGVFRVASRGKALTIVSGPDEDPDPHARMTSTGPGRWRLDVRDYRDKWEATPFSGTIEDLVDTLVSIGRLDPRDA